MDVGATDEGAGVVGSTDEGAAVDGTKVNGVVDVGEGLEMAEALSTVIGAADVDAGFVTGLNVGDVVDGLLTVPPVFVQNVDVLVGS